MSDVTPLYERALVLYKEDNLEEAARLMEELITKDPQHRDGLEALGVIYGKMKRFDEAIALMKRLAAMDPENIMAHANMSQFYMLKGMIAEAEREQAEARRLSWKAELRAKKVSDSEIRKKEEEEKEQARASVERRIEQYKQVIAYDPADVLGYFTLGSVYLQARRFTEASETLAKAIEADPAHSPSYAALGEALEHTGKLSEAAEVYRRGVRVADEKGDIIPLRKMEARLRKLESQL
jgi:tetratricopeptide (TPR) repeat protein